MGRQVNFYMTRADEREFMRFVRSDRNVEVFKGHFPSQEIPFLAELPQEGEVDGFQLFLWDRDNSPPPIVRYVKEQGYFVPDFFSSEIIEFSRCFIDERRVLGGRIWAEMAFWDGNPPVLHRKSESFRKWFSRLATWIKRHATRNSVGEYVMPGAAEFVKNGGQLRQFG